MKEKKNDRDRALEREYLIDSIYIERESLSRAPQRVYYLPDEARALFSVLFFMRGEKMMMMN